MPYVMRNTEGDICGLCEQLQEGYADEFLPDDDAAVVAFRNSQQLYQPTLEGLKAQLRVSIDFAAEAQRLKYITPGAGQAMTYQAKAAEAKAFLASEDPQQSDYPMLSAEVGITAGNLAAVAQIVASAYAQWQAIGAAIEAARLGGKAAVEAASDATAAQAAADAVTWPAPQVA
ncbi:hypothetical protein [Rhizobium leguminosarum]|uniref:hypothetical protein n=1 Tax=Rhizobium leguminosarum TaxID=384 RepID=UPI00140FF463|nr:hypothetical protein [Rhizobium leguminosarum]QIO64768.1 hypothetical protein HA462_06800 [Rhizobium leguminosarum bv. trifolii]